MKIDKHELLKTLSECGVDTGGMTRAQLLGFAYDVPELVEALEKPSSEAKDLAGKISNLGPSEALEFAKRPVEVAPEPESVQESKPESKPTPEPVKEKPKRKKKDAKSVAELNLEELQKFEQNFRPTKLFRGQTEKNLAPKKRNRKPTWAKGEIKWPRRGTVLSAVVELLQSRWWTKDELAKAVAERNPERELEKIRNTIRSNVPTEFVRRRGIPVEKDGRMYRITKKENSNG